MPQSSDRSGGAAPTYPAGGDGFDPRVDPLQPDKSLGELFGDMSTGIGNLVRAELELAKTEATAEVSRAGKSAGMFAAAGMAALLALTFLSAGLAWLLDQGLNRALAFAIVGVLWAIAALVLMSAAKNKIKDLKVLPVTKDTLKEDVQWAKAQKN